MLRGRFGFLTLRSRNNNIRDFAHRDLQPDVILVNLGELEFKLTLPHANDVLIPLPDGLPLSLFEAETSIPDPAVHEQ
jgi:hypothetical protein